MTYGTKVTVKFAIAGVPKLGYMYPQGTFQLFNPIWTNGTDLARFKKTLFSEHF